MDQRQSNRARYPEIARLYDELRATFGDVSVTSLTPRGNK
jgi:hypothetical protein